MTQTRDDALALAEFISSEMNEGDRFTSLRFTGEKWSWIVAALRRAPTPTATGEVREAIEKCAKIARKHSELHYDKLRELYRKPGEAAEKAASNCADDIEEEIRGIAAALSLPAAVEGREEHNNWFPLKGDSRLGRCASEGCGGQPTWRLEAGGVGSNYCSGCKAKIDTPLPPRDGRAEPVAWQDDPSSDERWNAGLDYGMVQLCAVLNVDPKKVTWDAATETLDGDVSAAIYNVFIAKYGDDWSADALPPAPETLSQTFERVIKALNYQGGINGDENSLTVGEIRRAL